MSDERFSGYRGKKVLITGGLGFIGSNLALRLVAAGADVTLVDSLVPEYGGNTFNVEDIKNDVRINVSDIRDEFSLKYLIRDLDYVFNLAGQTSHLDSMEDPLTDLEINCRAQLILLESCRRYNKDVRVVFASTRQIYGKPAKLPVDESHLLSPVDVNGINKMAGEWYHTLYNNVHEISTTSLRLTNTYGPRMRVKDARQTFLGIWIRRLLENESFEVWDGGQLRDLSYVDDAVEAFMLTGLSDRTNGQVFNVGALGVTSLSDLARTLVELNGGGDYVVKDFPSERKRIDIGDYFADDSRLRSVVGWEPRTTLRDGLARTLEFYKRHLDHYV